MTDPSRIRISGPLEVFAAGFASELSRQGYTPNSARLQMHLMAHLSRLLAGVPTGSRSRSRSTRPVFAGN